MPEPHLSEIGVYDFLRHLLVEIAGIPEDRISPSATIENDLTIESVAFVEIQVALEEEYDIQIDPVRVVELNELGGIADYIHRLIATGGR